MQLAQRVLVVVTMIVILMLGITEVHQEKAEKLQNQWEVLQTERFLKRLCKSGSLSLEEYVQYVELFNKSGTTSGIELTEYRKEQDLDGNLYYDMVSWNEMQEVVLETGFYIFEPESIVRINIGRKNQRVRNDYYGIVSGKE